MSVGTTSGRRGRRVGRVLVFTFGHDLAGLLSVVAAIRAAGGRPDVIDLSYTGQLERDYAFLGARHVSGFAGVDGVREARDRATAWMQAAPKAVLDVSGRSLLETFSEDGVPSWWRFEISLQERAYLVARLVETVRAAAGGAPATHFVVVDAHESHGWQAPVLATAAEQAGLAPFRAPAVAPVGPPPPAPVSGPRRWRTAAATTWVGLRRTETVVRKVVAVGLAVIAVAAAVLLAIAGAILVTPLWLLRIAVGVPNPGLGRMLVGFVRGAAGIVRRSDVLLIVFVAAVAVAVGLLGVPVFAAARVAVTVAALCAIAYAAGVLVAPPGEGLRRQLMFPARVAVRAARAIRRPRTLLRAVRNLRRGAGPSGGRVRAERARIAVLVDAGNLRARTNVSTGRASEYIPYLEGVIEALGRRDDAEAVVVLYGSRLEPIPGVAGTLVRLWRQLVPGRAVPLRAFLTQDLLDEADRLAVAREAEWAALARDRGLRTAFTYDGVDCFGAFVTELHELYVGRVYALAHEAALGSVLDLLEPDAVVAYNYEGVFRRMLPAILARGIPLLGVQQALGPYGHALDHGDLGYDRPSLRHDGGVPFPDLVAVWGQRDIIKMTAYGQPRERLVETGYARTDTYVNERESIRRERVLRRFGLPPGAKVVAYTAVARVLGTGLMRTDRWEETLVRLIALSRRDPSVHILVKPWPGDDMALLRRVLDRDGTPNVVFVDPHIDVHNVELLAITDVVAGTFSSLFSEAVIMGAVPVMLDYPETRYYFGPETEGYHAISLPAATPEAAEAEVRRVLGWGAAERDAFRAAALERLKPIFGPLDGRAADRIAAAAVRLARPAGAGAAVAERERVPAEATR